MSILILAEHEEGEIRPATLNVVTAATQIGGDIHLLVAGNGISGIAEKASAIAGVSKVLVADDAAYTNELAENLSALVVKHAEGYSHILFAATAAGKNVMPRVAALLDVSGAVHRLRVLMLRKPARLFHLLVSNCPSLTVLN